MLKRTIYSIMALSLTLMPMLEVMATDWDGTYPITSDVTINGSSTHSQADLTTTNTWTGGTITNNGGTLTITEYAPPVTGVTPNYIQEAVGSSLVLFNGGTLDMRGDYLSTSNLARIDAGAVHVGYNGSTGANLIVGTGARISPNAVVSLLSGNTIELKGNTSGSATSGDPSLVINSGDTWAGNITTSAASGYLSVVGDISKTGTYTQTTGKIQINGNSSLDLNNSNDNISGGNVRIGDGTNASVLTVSKGTIGKNAEMQILANSTLNVADSGNVIVNDGDEWNGAINVSGGTLTFSKRLNIPDDDDYTDTTTATKTYNQTGGTMNLGNADGGAELTLATSASKLSGGNVNIANDNSAFTLANSSVNTGNINLSAGSFTVNGSEYKTNNQDTSKYTQTGGNLYLTNGAVMNLAGTNANPSEITGGTVNIGTNGISDADSQLSVETGGKIAKDAIVDLRANNYIHLTGNAGGQPSLVLDNANTTNADSWAGTITNDSAGHLRLEGFNNTGLSEADTAIYQQTGGTLSLGLDESGNSTVLNLATPESFISGGVVSIENGNILGIVENTTVPGKYGTISNNAEVEIAPNGMLVVAGRGTAVLNDNLLDIATADTLDGNIVVGVQDGVDNPTLTLMNVTKDFTKSSETGSLALNSGNLNLYANERGGSHLTIYGDKATDGFTYAGGQINVKGYDKNKLSSLTYKVTKNGSYNQVLPVNMKGNAELVYEMNGHNVTFNNVAPTGTGPNNTMVEKGNGKLTINTPNQDLKMGYNVRVEDGSMTVNAKNMTIGTTYKNEAGNNVSYGDLQIGKKGNKSETHFYTNALQNKILGSMIMNNGWYHTTNPRSTTTIGKNLTAGSGIDMMYGKINSINLKGTTTVNNLKLKIDVDPATYRADTINSSRVVANPNSKLDLVDYNLLSTPTRDKYTFRVVNAKNENYEIASTASKVVSQKKITWTELGGYTMIPSAVKGAFDMVLLFHNPQVFRGQVGPNVIYANQQVINNQLFDRMIYSNLPYFNGDCTNKTAAADSLYSPYQYSTNDTGLWFKPYANFENIRMTYVGKVKNYSYGAMIGADFAKKKWGAWSFIPSAYIGYNGGYSKYNGNGLFYGGTSLLHNGGQAGFMGTFTRKDFVTALATYVGGYHNRMDYSYGSDDNAMWNAGVASKTAYNIHLPWDFILQPTLYMAYNYVGASSFNGYYEGYRTKVDPLNAFSIAPGVSLIWQKETFSIYGLFQAMFNIGSRAGGRVAEMDLPGVGIRDPYFEYGLGASKFFKERYSGYGQVVARSGSRTGVGFQLGLNVKL